MSPQDFWGQSWGSTLVQTVEAEVKTTSTTGKARRADERQTRRVQLEMTMKAWDRLNKIKDTTEASSYADVIKEALRLYEFMIQEDDKGGEFVIRRGDKETAVKLFA